ncbi:MAG: hypothetical protein J6P58_02335, partial [Oscillospiraceae bacterium]|nr:hypothetical protein [Oscillospiraceae bacterium]
YQTTRLAANDLKNHSPDAHCNEYMAKQLRCFAAPRSGATKSLLAFRHPIVIIDGGTEDAAFDPENRPHADRL